MENKVFLQNLKQIEHYDSNLANKILTLDIEKSNISLAQNENGEFNLLYGDIPVHSTISAIEEASNIASNFEDDNNTIKIIYGLGLGYLADVAAQKIQKGKIIIYEPNLEIVKFVLSIAQIDALYKQNVFLCTQKDMLYRHLENFINEKSSLSISFLNSYKGHLDDIKDVLFSAQRLQGEIIGNKNTILAHAPNAFLHTVFNIGNIFKNPDISKLKDIYKGKSALIACAGPSLEENIDEIKKNRDKFIIFALNPVLKTLIKHGISPDFTVAIENKNIIKQFENIDTKQLHFIIEASVNHRVALLNTKKTFNYIAKDNFFNNWVLDCFNIKSELKTSGSVSYTAFLSAVLLGFENIILIGQDLAYKNGLCYSKECQWGTMECVWDENEKKYKIVASDWEKLIDAFQTPPKTRQEAQQGAKKRLEFLNQNIVTVKSSEGKMLPSKADYAVFIKCFEEAAVEVKAKNPKIKLYNASKGALIKGFEDIDLSSIAPKLQKVERIDLDSYLPDYDKTRAISKIDILSCKMKEYQTLVNDLITINREIIEESQKSDDFSQEMIQKIKKHSSILSSITKLKDDAIIGFIVSVYLLTYEKYFKINYLENMKILKETLEKMNRDYLELNKMLLYEIKGLGNSKALILK